jgi:23S rRNA pseudouridine2605 synthase
MVRINKYLAQCNIGSRREVEKYIINGDVKVNGEVCKDLAKQINEDNDEVMFHGKHVKPKEETIYIMLNKPKNYLVTAKDDFQRKTVFDLLPDFNVHLFSVGRLDYMSTGLLILTNDGEFANKIIHPKNKLPKVYRVKAKGVLTDDQIKKLYKIKEIEGKSISKPKIKLKEKNENSTILRMTIFEGRKRQIRQMIRIIGSEVLELKRTQIGSLKLDKLPIGMWRFLKPNEVLNLIKYKRGKYENRTDRITK